MSKHCPYCDSTDFYYNYGRVYCNNCGASFNKLEADTCDDSCPTCGSDNITYYSKSKNGKHHYCQDCGTRW